MKNRSLLFVGGLAGLIGLVIVGAVVWYLASPLFIDDVVEEEFPFDVPSAEQLAQMPEAEREKIETEVMEASAQMPDKVMEEAMPEPVANTEPVAVLQGRFVDADSFHQGSGDATIYQLPDGSQVLRFENFDVTNGPDLHVVLSSHPAPASREDLGQDYIDLGELKARITKYRPALICRHTGAWSSTVCRSTWCSQRQRWEARFSDVSIAMSF
jgi:hypothetical protein